MGVEQKSAAGRLWLLKKLCCHQACLLCTQTLPLLWALAFHGEDNVTYLALRWQIKQMPPITLYQQNPISFTFIFLNTWRGEKNLIIKDLAHLLYVAFFPWIYTLLITIIFCLSYDLKYWELGRPQPDSTLSSSMRLRMGKEQYFTSMTIYFIVCIV